MLSVLLEVDDASLHPLILCDSFALVVENEMANTCLFPMEYILNLKLDIKKKVFYGDCIVFMKVRISIMFCFINITILIQWSVSFISSDHIHKSRRGNGVKCVL
ncbi:hypothetical protein T4B_12889 [Trichinella pseudospiralis]|uniref:Uncharacterized protein n=1 Tax=Trichinella pseudospiralis TaxID=6337 RepID=A0A0V1IKY6_TRIPS|nr:hypothetical protein T4B_12889 [Trichinella pseudospiralis]